MIVATPYKVRLIYPTQENECVQNDEESDGKVNDDAVSARLSELPQFVGGGVQVDLPEISGGGFEHICIVFGFWYI